MRWCALVLAAVAATAQEPPATVQMLFNAKSGVELGSTPGQTYSANESVSFLYGGARLACERLRYMYRARPHERFIESAQVEAAAGDDARIELDTTACTLPQVAFRGRLTPRSAVVQSLPTDERLPGMLRWSLVMEDVGEFRARIRNQSGEWVPYAGWARRIDMTVVAGADGKGDARLTDMAMHGVPATAEDDGRPARLIRPAAAGVALPLEELIIAPIGIVLARIGSSRFDVDFDGTGALRTIRGASDNSFEGDQNELFGNTRKP